jgi:transposase
MAGRKPMGPALVEHLEGSQSAKGRLALILATNAGQITVVEAARRLGISEAMFYKLRNRVLQAALEDLEPKRIGRPPQAESEAERRDAELQQKVAELEREVAAQAVRLELAQVLPRLARPAVEAGVKKTTRTPQRPKRSRRVPRPQRT